MEIQHDGDRSRCMVDLKLERPLKAFEVGRKRGHSATKTRGKGGVKSDRFMLDCSRADV